MTENSKHFDLEAETKPRKGWFVKYSDDMPQYKDYRASCKQGGEGFFGPNFAAHHIIPKESIDESTAEIDPAIIDAVQLATPYILNNPKNMIGLPSFWSFSDYYRGKKAHDDPAENPKNSQRWVNTYEEKTRNRWQAAFDRVQRKVSRAKYNYDPENYPIHLPVNWGHAQYTKEVTSRLKSQVWNVLQSKKAKHEVAKQDLEKIKEQLVRCEQSFLRKLKGRGATSLQLWERRKNRDDDDWYGPYTMTDIYRNPIWG